MATGFHISGVREFEAAIGKINNQMRMAGYRIAAEGAQIIIKNARKQFTTVAVNAKGAERVLSRGGRLKKGERLSRQGRHIEGDAPHIRSGYLARSIQFTGPREVGLGRWESTTGPTASYGRRIELGFTGADSLGRNYDQPAFPFLRPGLEQSRDEIEALAEREWRKAGVL